MAQFRALKTSLRTALSGPDWQAQVAPQLEEYGHQTVGPLFSFLLVGGAMTGRAALCLGKVVAHIADKNKEDGRVIMRRFMWHMNEESGNIGWGIPEAMAACLVAHEGLAKEFHRILLSYIRDRDGDSNFCDYAPLRRHCFWAVGFFVSKRPELVVQSGLVPALFDALIAGFDDEDSVCRAYAAWALGQSISGLTKLHASTKFISEKPLIPSESTYTLMQSRLDKLAESSAYIELFEDGQMQSYAVRDIAKKATETLSLKNAFVAQTS